MIRFVFFKHQNFSAYETNFKLHSYVYIMRMSNIRTRGIAINEQ
ncbi:hypothetical protein A359_07800 [secondary endosymbiont of Ctenarytaina eucalypti]|uniref:Uncharacterized protein n=1 Tax=secondary endosymbiont of Ctenarytaina eucalypti TaxID=1199245 RepID=J3Z4D2_9ENTR|nr:hypothetical protein A359_07800 [secondary endosymbiont of Ctenarytaina eucalypti]